MSDAPLPKSVSRFEANLLRILRFILKQAPAEQAMRLIHDRLERPKCLSAAAVELVQDSLAKGTVLYLVRAGAWKRDRFLRSGEAKFGRLWERSPVDSLTLEFSKQTLDFLIWLTSVRPREEKTFWSGDDESQTIGDRLFCFLAYDSMRTDAELATWMRMSSAFRDNALVRLAYPNDFVGDGRALVPSFDIWLAEPGTFVLESLQPILEHRWLEIERTKGVVGDWTLLGQQGEAQGQLLDAFTEAVNSAGRRDMVRFLLVVMSRVLATLDMAPTFWTGGLQGAGPARLADRLTIQRNALSVLRNAERFRNWEQESRRSGYLDEDYAVSRFWISEFERFVFTTIAERADRVLQQMQPLRGEAIDGQTIAAAEVIDVSDDITYAEPWLAQMNSQRAALIREIASDPNADHPYSMLADWLKENGELLPAKRIIWWLKAKKGELHHSKIEHKGRPTDFDSRHAALQRLQKSAGHDAVVLFANLVNWYANEIYPFQWDSEKHRSQVNGAQLGSELVALGVLPREAARAAHSAMARIESPKAARASAQAAIDSEGAARASATAVSDSALAAKYSVKEAVNSGGKDARHLILRLASGAAEHSHWKTLPQADPEKIAS